MYVDNNKNVRETSLFAYCRCFGADPIATYTGRGTLRGCLWSVILTEGSQLHNLSLVTSSKWLWKLDHKHVLRCSGKSRW